MTIKSMNEIWDSHGDEYAYQDYCLLGCDDNSLVDGSHRVDSLFPKMLLPVYQIT
jgi:hypothetical protein